MIPLPVILFRGHPPDTAYTQQSTHGDPLADSGCPRKERRRDFVLGHERADAEVQRRTGGNSRPKAA